MSSAYSVCKRASHESLERLSEKVEARLTDKGAELVYKNIHTEGGLEVLLLVFEKFYFRTASYASLTIQCIHCDDQRAIVVGTGGGKGIPNISYGANKSFAKDAVETLKEFGFTECTLGES